MSTEFCLLGRLEVRSGGAVLPVPPGKQRVLLATLLLSANQVVSADRIAEMLWGSQPPLSAPVTLRNYVRRLRQALASAGPERISAEPRGYLISVGAGELDVSVFETLARSANTAARDGDWVQAAAQARTALSLWRGDPLADVESDALAQREIPRLTEIRLQVLQTRIDADLHLGAHAIVVPELQALVTSHPLREELHALLMLALYRSGRQAEALAAYRNARNLLVEELGTEPAAALRGLHERILVGDPDLCAPPAATVTAAPPQAPRTAVPGLMPGIALQPAGTALVTDPGSRTAVRTVIQASETAAHAAPLQGPGNGTSGAGLQHMAEHAVQQGTAATRSPARRASPARGRRGKVLLSLLVGAIAAGVGVFVISTSTTSGAGQSAVGQGRGGLGSHGAAPRQPVRDTFQGGADGWEQIQGDITLRLVSQPAFAGGDSLLLTTSGTGASVAGTASEVAQLTPGDTVTYHVWSSGQPGSIQPLVNSDSNHYSYAPARPLPSTAGWFILTWKIPPTSTVEGIGLQVVNPGNGSLTLALGDLSWP